MLIQCPSFPLGVSVEIVDRDESRYVVIHSWLHMRKSFELPHCYSMAYAVGAILRDGDFLTYLSRYR